MNPDILSISLKTCRKANPLHVPQRGTYGERYQLTGLFTHLLIYEYLFISKALRKERPSMFHKSGAHIGTDAHSRALISISFGVPQQRSARCRPPSWSPLGERCPVPRSIHHSSCKVPSTRAPLLIPGSPRT